MMSVAICGALLKELELCEAVESIEIAGIPITVGLIETPEPTYNAKAPENRSMVLIKVRAFSCNYRDKAVILRFAQQCRESAYYFIGSEFVGEVVAVGADVSELQVGDRVIANNQYPESGVSGLAPGIPSNHTSQRYRIIHEAKVIKVPQEMPDEVAAAFSIAAQTVYSILRKLALRQGANVLVTSAKSNTSLFAINALLKYGVNVYAASGSKRFEKELKEMGVKQLIQVDPALESFRHNSNFEAIIAKNNGFDYVIDPFFDLHIGKVAAVIAPGGKYITCGFYDQYSDITGTSFAYHGEGLREIMARAIVDNIQIIGNCLGQKEDLQEAIVDYLAGSLKVVIDAVFRDQQVGSFFHRTYNAQDRFGKVVYQYND